MFSLSHSFYWSMYLLFLENYFLLYGKRYLRGSHRPTGNSQDISRVIALSNMYAFCHHITLKKPKKGSTAFMATMGGGMARQRWPPFRSCFPWNSHWMRAVPTHVGADHGEVAPHAPWLKSILSGGPS